MLSGTNRPLPNALRQPMTNQAQRTNLQQMLNARLNQNPNSAVMLNQNMIASNRLGAPHFKLATEKQQMLRNQKRQPKPEANLVATSTDRKTKFGGARTPGGRSNLSNGLTNDRKKDRKTTTTTTTTTKSPVIVASTVSAPKASASAKRGGNKFQPSRIPKTGSTSTSTTTITLAS